VQTEIFLPSTPLRPFIRQYLHIEAGLGAENKVIPDTTVTMTFCYKGMVANMPATAVSGLKKSARTFAYEKDTANLLVIFNEGGLSAFSGIPAHELFDLSIPSENIFRRHELNDILQRLAEADSNRDRAGIVDSFFRGRLVAGRPDALIASAIRLISQQNGMIRVKELATSLFISQDPFEKRFRSVAGATPKQFASIVRLRRLISKYPSYSSLTQASYDAGYFDQSHFIREFRGFTGQSPKDFFQSSRYW
jgi:AraC-like DNA-binding protein